MSGISNIHHSAIELRGRVVGRRVVGRRVVGRRVVGKRGIGRGASRVGGSGRSRERHVQQVLDIGLDPSETRCQVLSHVPLGLTVNQAQDGARVTAAWPHSILDRSGGVVPKGDWVERKVRRMVAQRESLNPAGANRPSTCACSVVGKVRHGC